MSSKFIDELKALVFSGHPVIAVKTFEEARCIRAIKEGVNQKKKDFKIFEWDHITGLVEINDNGSYTKPKNESQDPSVLLDTVQANLNQTDGLTYLYLIKDFHFQFAKQLKAPDLIRKIKNMTPKMNLKFHSLIFIDAEMKIPVEITKDVKYLKFELPNDEELAERLEFTRFSVEDNLPEDQRQISEDIKNRAIAAARGLTTNEAESIFALSFVKAKAWNDEFVNLIRQHQIEMLKENSLLTHIDTDIDMAQVGGLENAKAWIAQRAVAYKNPESAKAYGLPNLKGIGLNGIPGSGKTLLAKAIAKAFGVPLFKLDIGNIFNKWVGGTEANMQRVINTIDALGDVVILIDEVEKYLNTGATSGSGDSGASSRSFGTFASWLQDRKGRAFIVFTSNNFLRLPPELTRPGRFDALFWLDLPTEVERKDILEVVLKKKGQDIQKFNVPKLVKETENFTGAEIEHGLTEAMFQTYAANKVIDMETVVAQYKKMIPHSQLHRETLNQMRAKVRECMIPASVQLPETTPALKSK